MSETDGAGAAGGAALRPAELPALFARVAAALERHRPRIDELNVFPVPDGDTGTNMLLTVRAGVEALEQVLAAGTRDATEVARAVIRGAVRGARGNSGVILSQVLRAVVEVVAEADEVDAGRYADALTRARELAYDAVAQPVEGTILTVIARAADAADAAVADGVDLVVTSARTCDAARAAVEATRDQLDVLRDAGVVDAGARGFEVLLAAVHAHLTGEDPPAASDHPDVPAGPFREGHLGTGDTCDGSLDYRYEVQYLLDAAEEAASALRARLELLGDSVVVVAAGDLLNVHVHTDDVGAAIEEGLAVGTPSEIEVTHFGDQLAARRAADPPAAIGAVAVVSGAGAVALVRRLGAVPVEGTAGALPSVADLLNACGELRASNLVLLPGHRNAVPTAFQAAEVAVAEGGRPMAVVEEATSLPAVLAALAVLEPDADADAVLADLHAAAGAVRCGEVVGAVRDATTPVGQVVVGQPLAVVDGEVVAAADDPLAALGVVCDHLELATAELVSLLVGAEVDAAERDRAVALVRARADGAEVEVVDAGQRPARYLVGVE